MGKCDVGQKGYEFHAVNWKTVERLVHSDSSQHPSIFRDKDAPLSIGRAPLT